VRHGLRELHDIQVGDQIECFEIEEVARLRHTPRLSFQADHTFDEAARINALLHHPRVVQDVETGPNEAGPDEVGPDEASPDHEDTDDGR
jgi:ribosome-binding factor A